MSKNTALKEMLYAGFATSAPIILALEECDDELRIEAIELFKQLESHELDKEQCIATAALLAEILFPNTDDKGVPGLDLAEAEAIAAATQSEAKEVLSTMDNDESMFAQRLRELMDAKGISQMELAAKVGIGQPAVSMMLNRSCRPQRKTILRFAEVFGVSPQELWLDFYSKDLSICWTHEAVFETIRGQKGMCGQETKKMKWGFHFIQLFYTQKPLCAILYAPDSRCASRHQLQLAPDKRSWNAAIFGPVRDAAKCAGWFQHKTKDGFELYTITDWNRFAKILGL